MSGTDSGFDVDEEIKEDSSTEIAPTDEMDSNPSRSKAPDEQFCSSCGSVIKKEAKICPECGVEQNSSSEKNPGVAALLSGIGFLIPIAAGAGQIYNGEIGKGIAFGLIQAVNFGLIFLLIGLVTFPLFGIYTVYDAYNKAQDE